MPSTILCIDNDRKVLDQLKRCLDDHATLIHCDSLNEAFRIVVNEEPDLVLLEIRLRSGSGLDFVERLRGGDTRISSTPIVVITSAGRTPGLYGRATQLGVADYLTKPLRSAKLAACVKKALKRKRQAPSDSNEDSASQVRIGSGKLADLPFPELLDRVYRRGESGVLIVGDARERTGIQIRNGSPSAVTLPRREDLDDFLIRTGRLSADERDRAINEAALGISSIDEILLGLGVIDEEGLADAYRDQAEEAVFRLFELRKGRYRFESGRKLKGARSLDITRSAQSITVCGVLAHMDADDVRSALARYRDLYVVAGSDPEPHADDVPFSEAQRAFVAGLVGDLAVGDFVEGSEFEQRTLYSFAILGAIDLCPDPMLVLDEALADAPAPEEPLDEIELDQLVSEPVETAEKVEPRDFAHEEGLFEDRRFTPEPSAAAQDLSHEDDLFEERVFEEDSFENEMVEERPTSNAIDADPEPGALVEIEALLSGESDATPANPEAELEPDPRSEMKRDEAPPEPKAEREPSKKKRARKKKRKKEQEGRGKRKQRKKAAPNPVEVQEVEAGTPADEAVAEAAKPEVTAEPKVAAQPEVRTEPGASPAKEPKPTVTEDSRSGYEIAPFGTIQTDAKERAIIAERVRQRADRRVGHLIDRAGKQVGTTAAAPSGDSEAERALQAESWFRTGRDRLKAKKYDEAVEAFGMSAHLDPAEGEYVSHLGYALYLSKPDHELVRKEALEDIARGIKLSPDREISYVFLGRIFKVGGELLNAEKMFRRALEIRPHCREAAQELRLIEMREQKKNAGFFGRFLK